MQQMLLPILMFAALGAMMFYGMRKQKRVAAATREMQDSLVPGARVMTTSGLHATITAIVDDTIELEIAPGVRTTWIRAAVREVVVPVPTEFDDADIIDGVGGQLDDSTGAIDFSKDRKSNDLN
jgi:preprotein translocase subunit YajC